MLLLLLILLRVPHGAIEHPSIAIGSSAAIGELVFVRRHGGRGGLSRSHGFYAILHFVVLKIVNAIATTTKGWRARLFLPDVLPLGHRGISGWILSRSTTLSFHRRLGCLIEKVLTIGVLLAIRRHTMHGGLAECMTLRSQLLLL